MPGWLQLIAHINPVTYAVDALRALLVGGRTARPVLLAVAWTAAWSPCSPRSPSAATGADKAKATRLTTR
jgi:hypothetical protein